MQSISINLGKEQCDTALKQSKAAAHIIKGYVDVQTVKLFAVMDRVHRPVPAMLKGNKALVHVCHHRAIVLGTQRVKTCRIPTSFNEPTMLEPPHSVTASPHATHGKIYSLLLL